MHKFIRLASVVAALAFAQGLNAHEVEIVKLPAVEDINATTDLRPFLARGVPLELMRSVLRRAWVVDPRIRNFRGLQENAWDFDDPNGVPGFGRIEPRETARLFAEHVIGGNVSR